MLVLVYLSLAPTVLQKFANKFVIAGLDALAMLFWFAGFIALAVFHHDIGYCYGRVCHTMVAAIVFGAFEWYDCFFFFFFSSFCCTPPSKPLRGTHSCWLSTCFVIKTIWRGCIGFSLSPPPSSPPFISSITVEDRLNRLHMKVEESQRRRSIVWSRTDNDQRWVLVCKMTFMICDPACLILPAQMVFMTTVPFFSHIYLPSGYAINLFTWTFFVLLGRVVAAKYPNHFYYYIIRPSAPISLRMVFYPV